MLGFRAAQSSSIHHSTSRRAAACSCVAPAGARQACPQLPRQQHQLGSGPAAAAWQQRALVQLPRAVKDEEAEIDRIAKQAAQGDIWGSELVGNAVKVGLVAGVVAVVVLIANLAQPLYENTIKSFPTPAEYEAYEAREEAAEGRF